MYYRTVLYFSISALITNPAHGSHTLRRCILKLAYLSAVSASCLHLPPPLPAKGRREAVTGSRLMGHPAAIGRRLRGAEGCGRQLRRGRVAAPGAPTWSSVDAADMVARPPSRPRRKRKGAPESPQTEAAIARWSMHARATLRRPLTLNVTRLRRNRIQHLSGRAETVCLGHLK
jgi:hypothetical protein